MKISKELQNKDWCTFKSDITPVFVIPKVGKNIAIATT